MSKTKKMAASMLLALCAASAYAPSVLARSSAAIAGFPYNGADAHCFFEASGGPINVCTDTKAWVMPIVYDAAGDARLNVSARGVDGTAKKVTCTAFSQSWDGLSFRQGSTVSTVRRDGAFEFMTVTVAAQLWGGTWVTCAMDQNTHILSYHWNL